MPIKLTLEQFIKKSYTVHHNEYDYSLVNYINSTTKIYLIHIKCGKIFSQQPYAHLNGRGCPHCFKTKPLSNEEFIAKAKKIHNDQYDYSNVNYRGANVHVDLVHLKCNRSFNQIAQSHLAGHGCLYCSGKIRNTLSSFIEKSNKTHNEREYDYSQSVYYNAFTKVKIFHNNCQQYFFQTPTNHMSGQGCSHCFGNKLKTNEEFIVDARKIHGNEYNYNLLKYKGSYFKINIIHNKCNKTFTQTPHNHLNGDRCPHCYSNAERGTYFSIKMNKNFIFDSLWEKERMINFDQDQSIIKWDRCSDKIKYFDFKKQKIRTYHPDFEITYLDKIVVEEVKGLIPSRQIENYLKFKAGINYFNGNKSYRIITKVRRHFVELNFNEWTKTIVHNMEIK